MVTRIDRILTRALKYVSVAVFAFLVVIVCWQVFARQILSSAPSWSDEGARYTFMVLIFLTAALVFIERGHIAVEVFARLLPVRVQRAVVVFAEVVVLVFAGWILVWGGSLITMNAWNQQMSALPFTVGQFYLVMPVTGVIIAYAAIAHVVDLVRGGRIWVISDDEEPI